MLDHAGIDCRKLGSLQRLNRVLELRLETGCAWADAAYDSGYSDQPHLVRHARGFTGMTPTRLDATLRSGECLPRRPWSARSEARSLACPAA